MESRRKLSDYKPHHYKKNFQYFDEYEATHREHQINALLATQNATKGQVISPCGTGKTRVQIDLHISEMIRLNKEYEYGVFVIASHRLTLNRQLLDQLIELAVKCGLPFDVVYVGSMRCDFSNYYSKYHNLGYNSGVSRYLQSTKAMEIEKFISESRESFRNVIVVSTYDSIACLKNIGTINIVTFDEAHNTLQDDFTANINQVKSNILKEYYFTATRKIAGEDGGMNNKDFYGEILIDVNPRSMLDQGEIVCPQLHVIDGDDEQTTDASNTEMLVKNTIEAYVKHKALIKQNSANPLELGAKLLVGCNSIEEMVRIYTSEALVSFSKDMNAFAISSDGCYYNGVKCGKEQFFVHLNDLSDAEDAIIFHVDMLTEGMDLPSITGVMPLRNLGLTKLVQLIGRALRLHKTDRANLYSGKIVAGQYKDYIKPYGYLIIPRHLTSINENAQMIKNAKVFYSEYGTKPEELIIQEKFISHQPKSLESMIPPTFKAKRDYDLTHTESTLVEEVNLSLLNEDLINMNASDQIKYFERMFDEQ